MPEGHRAQGTGLRAQGSGLGAQGSGLRKRGQINVEGVPLPGGSRGGWLSDPLPGGVRGGLDFGFSG